MLNIHNPSFVWLTLRAELLIHQAEPASICAVKEAWQFRIWPSLNLLSVRLSFLQPRLIALPLVTAGISYPLPADIKIVILLVICLQYLLATVSFQGPHTPFSQSF